MPSLRSHTFSRVAFAELGAGRPTPATLDELRRAQYGKHLLLLRELGQAVSLPSYAQLQALERTDPAAFRRTVADPLFGAWAAHTLRAGTTPCDDAERPPSRILTSTHDNIRISVRVEDSDPRRMLLGLPPSPSLTDSDFDAWQRHFDEAWRLLTRRHRPAAEALAAILTCIVPVESDPGAAGISATSADAYGAIALSAPVDATSLAVALLHEAQHNVLNATSYLFDLHDDPHLLGYSPWRDDPRPASGILHGAYAYLAVARFWRIESRATSSPLAAFEFARWREAVAGTAATLLAGRNLTYPGRDLIGSLAGEVEPWLADPVDPTVVHLARVANSDHHLRWRLRNQQPDPAGIDELTAAWHRGDPPPPVTSHLVPSDRRALPHSPRLRHIHEMLRAQVADGTGMKSAAKGAAPGVDREETTGDEAVTRESSTGGKVEQRDQTPFRRRPDRKAAAGDHAAPKPATAQDGTPSETRTTPTSHATATKTTAAEEQRKHATAAAQDGTPSRTGDTHPDGTPSRTSDTHPDGTPSRTSNTHPDGTPSGAGDGQADRATATAEPRVTAEKGDDEQGGTAAGTTEARETRATAVEAALLRGDYETVRHAYPRNDLDLVPLLIATGEDRAEVVAALLDRLDAAPADIIRWMTRGNS